MKNSLQTCGIRKIIIVFFLFSSSLFFSSYSKSQSLNNKVININIFGGVNPYNNPEWNNWNEPSNQTSQVLNYSDGTSSGVTIRTSVVFAYTENFAPYPTTMCPPEVGRYAMFSSTGAHTLTFNNLKTDGTVYDLEIYSSRKNTGNITRFNVNGQSIDINTASNYSNAARFFSLTPNTSRQIIITITRTAGTFAYVNGLKLVERSSANQPPLVNAGNNQTITLPASSVTLNGGASDADGAVTAVQWTKISGPTSFTIASPNSLQTSVTGLVQGTYDFELAVTDDDGDTGKDTVKVTVNPVPPNMPPFVNAGNDLIIILPVNAATLNGTVVDNDGSIISTTWRKITGPASFVITNPDNKQTTITDLSEGFYEFELSATDDDGDTGRDTIKITISPIPPNQPPTVNAGNNQTITLPASSVTLNGTASDADGTVAAVQWTKINGPTSFSITAPNSLQTSVTGLVQGTYDFELAATDDDGDTRRDTARITVNPAPPADPVIVANMTVDSFPRSSQYETYGLTKLPPGYAFSGNKRYPLLLWLHSATEGAAVSSPASTKGNKHQLIKMANEQSPVQWIANGWNLTAVNPKTGLRDTFIVIAPQHYNNWSYSYNELRFIIPNIISRYRVDTTRLYLMGISAGAAGINTCMGSRDSIFINRIAAAVTMISAGVNSASGPAGSFSTTQVESNLRLAAGYGTRVWTIAGEDDSFVDYNLTLHKNLNNLLPTPRMKFTVWNGFAHVSNGPWLDTNRRSVINFYGNTGACNNGCLNGGVPVQTNNNGSPVRGSGVTQDSLNVLEWLLMFQRNTTYTPLPTAVAGNDQTITLPASSVTLNGTGSNAGSGSSFTNTVWEKMLGPSAGTITAPNALTTTATGLIAGNYVFKLTVTNSFGLSHADMIRITVLNNQTHWFPTVTITSSAVQNITTSTATLTATATTTGTSIKSIRWMKVKTPNQTPKKLVWLGSSTLAGTGASSGDSTLYNRIVAFGNRFGIFSENINLALGGSSVFECMPSSYTPQGNEDGPLTDRNITYALANHPDANAIVISFPSNDYDLLSADRILFAYQTIYDSAVAAGKKCFIYTTQPREAFGTIARLRLREVSDSLLIRERNGRFAPGTIISVHTPLTDLRGELMRYNSGDGIHQNNSGHRVMANNTIGSSAFFPGWTSSSSVINSPNSFTTTVSGLTNGTHVFMISVTDNYDHTAIASATINVNILANQPPTVNAGNNQTITLPASSVTLNGTASDADGTVAALQWTKISGPTSFSITSPNSLQTSVTGLVQGTYDFELAATDDDGDTGRDTIRINVNPVPPNQPPTVNAGNNQTITLPASSVNLNGTATDIDGTVTAVQWTKISGPTSFSITSPNSLQTSVTGLVQGTYDFELAATDDDGDTGRDTIRITVNPAPPNQPPIVNAGNNQTITLPASSVNLNGTATDADGTVVAVQWTKISGPTSFSITAPNSLQTSVTGLAQGVYDFELAATDDDGDTGRDTIRITVNPAPPNQPPTVNAGNNQTITLPASSVNLNGTATDADGTVTAVQWTKISGPTSFSITSPNSLQTSVTGLVQGIYSFELTATDNNGATGKDTVLVTVNLTSGNKVININIFGGINPYNNPEWNNWNEPSNQTSQVLNYSDGTSSGVTIRTSVVFAYTENFAPYPTTMCPPEVGRYAMFSSTGAHTLTFNNLKTDGTVYDLEIYSSRKNTGNITRFTVNGRSIDINTASNYSNAAQFTNLLPNASGQIVITITRTAGTFAYVNGLKLTEIRTVFVKNK
ncbi:MAG: SGNH/GDSL hydrolase family protein [Lacibacter sp.]|jgi:chitodextrinase